jgi:hypothetical protein
LVAARPRGHLATAAASACCEDPRRGRPEAKLPPLPGPPLTLRLGAHARQRRRPRRRMPGPRTHHRARFKLCASAPAGVEALTGNCA